MHTAAIDSLIFSSSQNSLFHMHLPGAKKKMETVFVLGASSANNLSKGMLSVFQTKIRNFLKLFPFVKDRFDNKITNSRMEYTITHLIFPLAVTEIARAREAQQRRCHPAS